MILEFDPKVVAICATSFYKKWEPGKRLTPNIDLDRGDASLHAFALAQTTGYRVFITDGGSSQSYLEEAKNRGVTILKERERGIAPAKRQAFEAARDSDGCQVIILIQPEKDSVITSVPEIVSPILSGQADIVVPSRNRKLFEETYPKFQVVSETWANRRCNRIAQLMRILPPGQNLDWFFGVKAFKNVSKVLDLFMRKYEIADPELIARTGVNPEKYTAVDFFPVVEALHLGMKVDGVEIPFEYPSQQKAMEETLEEQFREKRDSQRNTIMREYVEYFRLMIGSPKSKLRPA